MRNRLSILLVLVLCFSACASMEAVSLRKLKMLDYSIKSVTPESLRSVTGSVEMVLNNGGNALDIRDIQGTVYKNGKVFVIGNCGDILIPKGNSRISVYGRARLGDEIGLMEFLQSLRFDPKDYTIDLSFNVVNKRGRATRVEKKGIPLTLIMR